MTDIEKEPIEELVHLFAYMNQLTRTKQDALRLQQYVSKIQVLNPEFYEANHRLLMTVLKELVIIELLLEKGKEKEDKKNSG